MASNREKKKLFHKRRKVTFSCLPPPVDDHATTNACFSCLLSCFGKKRNFFIDKNLSSLQKKKENGKKNCFRYLILNGFFFFASFVYPNQPPIPCLMFILHLKNNKLFFPCLFAVARKIKYFLAFYFCCSRLPSKKWHNEGKTINIMSLLRRNSQFIVSFFGSVIQLFLFFCVLFLWHWLNHGIKVFSSSGCAVDEKKKRKVQKGDGKWRDKCQKVNSFYGSFDALSFKRVVLKRIRILDYFQEVKGVTSWRVLVLEIDI